MRKIQVSTDALGLEALDVGSAVGTAKVEQATRVKRHERDFSMACLLVREAVAAHFRALGRLVTLAIVGDEVRVLPHAEAARYNARRIKRMFSRVRAAHRRNLGVDASALKPEEAERHERALLVNGRHVQALGQISRGAVLVPQAHRRDLPGPDSWQGVA